MPDTKQEPSDAMLIKTYFGLTATETVAQIKLLGPEAKAQLGTGIRNGTLTY